MSNTEIIPYVAILLSIITFFLSQFKTKASSALENRILILETSWKIYSNVLEKELGKMVHSPHRQELDALIEKHIFREEELRLDEAIRFISLLQEVIDTKDVKTKSEEIAINLLKASIASKYHISEELNI